MTDLEEPQNKTETQWAHNWLYSVLPITPEHELPAGGEYGYLKKRPGDLFILSGYCRICDQAFSVEVPIAYPQSQWGTRPLEIRKMNIPKLGCIDPRGIEANLG